MRYYLRGLNKEGYGEAVLPTMKEPIWKEPGKTIPIWLAKISFRCELEKFQEHLTSLPVTLVHPDLAKKIGIGWFEGEEQYELFDSYDICSWHIVSKDWFDKNKDKNLSRIVLIEKENKPPTSEWYRDEVADEAHAAFLDVFKDIEESTPEFPSTWKNGYMEAARRYRKLLQSEKENKPQEKDFKDSFKETDFNSPEVKRDLEVVQNEINEVMAGAKVDTSKLSQTFNAKPLPVRPSLYAMYYGGLKEIAYKHGYNLCIHGSMNRDFDLIAFPWKNNANTNHFQIADEMRKFIGGQFNDGLGNLCEGGCIWYPINIWRKTPFTAETDQQYYLDLKIFISQSEKPATQNEGDILKFIGKGIVYDREGQQIRNDQDQLLLDVRGWGAIQNLFLSKEGVDVSKASEFQDKMGEWVADAIRQKLLKPL